MKKGMGFILFNLLLCNDSYANYEIDTGRCAGTEYVYDMQGELVVYDPNLHTHVNENTPVFYADTQKIPHIFLNIAKAQQIIVQNTGEGSVNFRFRPEYYAESSGLPAQINPEVHYGIFSDANSPESESGALMPSKSAGRIRLNYTTEIHYGAAEILWDSATCFLEPPMITTLESIYTSGNRGSVSVNFINGGKAW